MDDPYRADIGRIQREIQEALDPMRPQRELQEALASVQASDEFQEALKALSKPTELQKALKALSKPTELQEALKALSRPNEFQEALHSLNAQQDMTEKLRIFSVLGTQEALTGALQNSLQEVKDATPTITERLIEDAIPQTLNLAEDFASSSALDRINWAISEAVDPATLASAQYLLTENFLKGNWPNDTMFQSLQSTITTLHTNYDGILRQLEEFAKDSRVHEIVTGLQAQTLVEEAARTLYQEDVAVEDIQPLVELGIDSQQLLSPSKQTLTAMRNLLIFAGIALLAVSSNPELGQYVESIQAKFMLILGIYTLMLQKVEKKTDPDQE